ncbi:MAG: LacI family DNA-binding transcriptional regulator [bacterium]
MKKKRKSAEGDGTGVRRATRDDVCRAAGVSTATVSRALNNKKGVGPELRAKILKSVRELNYVPQAAARHLSKARTDTVAVVFQDLTSGWFLTIFRGIMARCSGLYHVLTALSTREGDEFELPNRMLAERRVDGMIWLDPRVSPRMVAKVRDLGFPLVLIQMPVADPKVGSVLIENRDGSYEAVRHLLQLGYRQIVLVTGSRSSPDSMQKLEGAQRALREFNVDIPAGNILEGHHVAAHAVKALAARLDAGPRPEAIFAFNDEMAIAIVLWLRERGLDVPKDIAVVGFDGIPEARYVGLTTVETPLFDAGVLAAQMLLEALAAPTGEGKARQVVLRGQLCIRDTCGSKLKRGGKVVPSGEK